MYFCIPCKRCTRKKLQIMYSQIPLDSVFFYQCMEAFLNLKSIFIQSLTWNVCSRLWKMERWSSVTESCLFLKQNIFELFSLLLSLSFFTSFFFTKSLLLCRNNHDSRCRVGKNQNGTCKRKKNSLLKAWLTLIKHILKPGPHVTGCKNTFNTEVVFQSFLGLLLATVYLNKKIFRHP